MADYRYYNKNINSNRLEYHLIDNPTDTQKSSAYDGYTYVPLSEEINPQSINLDRIIIKVSRTPHYSMLRGSEPSGITWVTGTNSFETLYDTSGGAAISLFASPTSSSPQYIRQGDGNIGWKYYVLSTTEDYFELCGKAPSSLKYGEIAVNRARIAPRLFVQADNGDMIEFRDYDSQVKYVNEQINEVYDMIYEIHYIPGFYASPSVIFKNTETSVTATATLQFNGEYQSDFSASTPSGWSTGSTSGTTRTFTKAVTTSSNVMVSTTITKGSYSKGMSATIVPVNHIFYGQASASDKTTLTSLTYFGSAVTSPNGREYGMTMTAGNYFYIAVPSSLSQPSQVGAGGSGGFFEALSYVGATSVTDPQTNVAEEYKFYRTQLTQAAGTYNYYIK